MPSGCPSLNHLYKGLHSGSGKRFPRIRQRSNNLYISTVRYT